MGKVTVLALAAFLAGCASGGDFCDVQEKPIRPASADVGVISDSLSKQIVALNEKGAALCGWRP